MIGESMLIGEGGIVAAGEEGVDAGLGVPVFVAVAAIGAESVVAEALQVAVFDAEERHYLFVVVYALRGRTQHVGMLGFHKREYFLEYRDVLHSALFCESCF